MRAGFVELLTELANQNRVRIVASLRADLLGALSRDERLARLLTGNSFVLHPPGAAALRTIIRAPAQLVSVTVEDRLVDELTESARWSPARCRSSPLLLSGFTPAVRVSGWRGQPSSV